MWSPALWDLTSLPACSARSLFMPTQNLCVPGKVALGMPKLGGECSIRKGGMGYAGRLCTECMCCAVGGNVNVSATPTYISLTVQPVFSGQHKTATCLKQPASSNPNDMHSTSEQLKTDPLYLHSYSKHWHTSVYGNQYRVATYVDRACFSIPTHFLYCSHLCPCMHTLTKDLWLCILHP